MRYNKPSVAVITPSMGRTSLERSILSVKQQTYPCQHYVFVDGEKYHQAAQQILAKYPDVTATYLPICTGEKGWCNSRINAAAPFYVKEEIVCYLDDDNYYLSNHIETLVATLSQPNTHYAYAFRQFIDPMGAFICKDRSESLGHYHSHLPQEITIDYPTAQHQTARTIIKGTKIQLIDTNCYAFPRQLAQTLAKFWLVRGDINDQIIFKALNQYQLIGRCSEQFSMAYTINYQKMFAGAVYQQMKYHGVPEEKIIQLIKQLLVQYNDIEIFLPE